MFKKVLVSNSLTVMLLICLLRPGYSQDSVLSEFEFYGNTFSYPENAGITATFDTQLSEYSIACFYREANSGKYRPLIDSLISYKEKHRLNDWIYYQLIRKTAEKISPKAENYERYTLYKWFFLTKSGYDATLGIADNKLLFYVRSDDDISDIPFYAVNGKQYICLNYHDYNKIDFDKNKIHLTNMVVPEARSAFSYKITRLPEFNPGDYKEKKLGFKYGEKTYHFSIRLNPEVENIFANYPVVDFSSYFNIPLSRETYQSLVPVLKKSIKGMNQKKGVDYLMQFTRNAFLYEDDAENFGKEKRLSPEQTLFSDYSDCDDRAALFYFLVKEIYNLPMIAMMYPTHITMAVQFSKPSANSVIYEGRKYSVCEATPQQQDLRIGELAAKYQNLSYQVVYQYTPTKN